MRHANLLDRAQAALVLIDLQESYRPALHAWERVVAASALLLRGARLLGVPLVVTEQYPRGVGHTASEQALLELVQSAEATEFKSLQRLLKETVLPPDPR